MFFLVTWFSCYLNAFLYMKFNSNLHNELQGKWRLSARCLENSKSFL